MATENKNVVVKSNRLVEASYRLTLVEQQIILFAICKAREEKILITPSTLITISANEFSAMFGPGSTNVYAQLKVAASTLFDRRVVINDKDEKTGRPRKVMTRWVQDVAYIDGIGQIQVAFARKMIPYITRLEQSFTKYRLEKVGLLSSAHAVRLYEMMIQRLGMSPVPAISITSLKDALDLGNEYDRTDNLKRAVIDVAIKQINKLTDIDVSYEQVKTGRSITHFKFSIALKKTGADAITEKWGPIEVKEKVPRKRRPKQLELPGCITAPIEQNPNNPEVVAARQKAMDAAKKMRSRPAAGQGLE
ncbi:RepB family plasmid replication initiator protein [Actimicrobium sp. CCI2.3]|uniref:RepB family plasmid replication initiator protein n=1 Tax=Actimicrobium sp. CCI2.3 TaxID=3048616 RepID=UPI002AB4E9A1|nr:RepB family plasmid replication initiator protein [Actimicrobium sp. CCI2.3]MDY7576540.1 RepB family plasmid replication initiator protein [Actimicrobium sp. CCI2.3]MEB0023806.1 RepB family plasmid replication initiator protein [Actimicrobium sp. CCI2.3]